MWTCIVVDISCTITAVLSTLILLMRLSPTAISSIVVPSIPSIIALAVPTIVRVVTVALVPTLALPTPSATMLVAAVLPRLCVLVCR